MMSFWKRRDAGRPFRGTAPGAALSLHPSPPDSDFKAVDRRAVPGVPSRVSVPQEAIKDDVNIIRGSQIMCYFE